MNISWDFQAIDFDLDILKDFIQNGYKDIHVEIFKLSIIR